MVDAAIQKPNLIFGKQGVVKDDPEAKDGPMEHATGDSKDDESDLSTEGDQVIEESPVDTRVTYSSHPVANFAIGKYQFVKGQLKLAPGKEAERFERLLDSLPPYLKRQVVKLDAGAADRLVEGLRSKVVTGLDSTAGSVGPSATQQA